MLLCKYESLLTSIHRGEKEQFSYHKEDGISKRNPGSGTTTFCSFIWVLSEENGIPIAKQGIFDFIMVMSQP